MKTMAYGEAKNKLSALLDEVERTHEQVTITRHGKPSAVVLSVEDLDSLRETIYWLSQAGIRDDVAEAAAAIKSGQTSSSDGLRDELGL